jgi:hypothetical protein
MKVGGAYKSGMTEGQMNEIILLMFVVFYVHT